MKNISVKRIEYGSREYESELFLRNRILREPLGLNLFDEDLRNEHQDIHIGAFSGDVLTGVLILTKCGEDTVRIRQVAVREDMQRMGIGKELMLFCEQTAASEGFSKIILHSRNTAFEFYEKLGFTAYGEEFTEVGIAHLSMQKKI